MSESNANYKLPLLLNTNLVPRFSESLVKLAKSMHVISQDSMGISICLHYVRIRVTSRTTELTRVKEKPCVDVLVYVTLKVYVW